MCVYVCTHLMTLESRLAIKSHWDDPTEDKLGVYPASTVLLTTCTVHTTAQYELFKLDSVHEA